MRALALATLVLAFVAGPVFSEAPILSGNVDQDFAFPQVIVVVDNEGILDVGVPIPPFPEGTITGFEFTDIRFAYDRATDTMFVGMNFVGIAGDADGDGDPDSAGPVLAMQPGQDFPQFGGGEAFVVLFDTDLDTLPDVVVGVDVNNDLSGFQAAVALEGQSPALSFGAPLPNHTGQVFSVPSASQPDLEFTIPNFSSLPGFGPSNPLTDTFSFNVSAYSGSLDDAGIGEDTLAPFRLVFGLSDFDGGLMDGEMITDQFSDEGVIFSGESDCGNDGVFVKDPSTDPSSDDIIPTTLPFVISTKCDPEDNSSDSGTLSIEFVNPMDGESPAKATYIACDYLDIEDSGTGGGGRGNTFAIIGDGKGGMVNIPIPNSGNSSQYNLSYPEGKFGTFEPIADFFTVIGDEDDSGAVDSFCYNLEPCILDFRLTLSGPDKGLVTAGDRFPVTAIIENMVGEGREVMASLTASPVANPNRVIKMVEPKLLRLGRRFDNTQEPARVNLEVPEELQPRRGGLVRVRIAAKLSHPRTGAVLAQDVIFLNVEAP